MAGLSSPPGRNVGALCHRSRADQTLETVIEKIAALNVAAKSLGCELPALFMSLSFLSLSPIPALKLTDNGLVDAAKMELTNLFVVQRGIGPGSARAARLGRHSWRTAIVSQRPTSAAATTGIRQRVAATESKVTVTKGS
ncbi:MAG: adenine deaminase C-terminal domain-containing protein [Spartobacteria bacterium]